MEGGGEREVRGKKGGGWGRERGEGEERWRVEEREWGREGGGGGGGGEESYQYSNQLLGYLLLKNYTTFHIETKSMILH